MAESKLDQLKEWTKIVIDTGDIDSIKTHTPLDATTNPSLIYAAAQKPQYESLLKDAIEYAKSTSKTPEEKTKNIIDKLFVNFGCEILKIIPGRVSTEVDARLSFDIDGSLHKARKLIGLYEKAGYSRKRILIKLAATSEGIRAAEILEKEGIHCNMTLIFSIAQAIGAADAKATLVSPFVGRILDWYKKKEGVEGYPAANDPGVLSVKHIYQYFKKFGIKTQVMGASFRNIDEILELAGADLLTIAPNLLQELEKATGTIERKLSPEMAAKVDLKKIHLDESTFRWMINEDEMATEKLAEGIRNFAKDTVKLEDYIQQNYT